MPNTGSWQHRVADTMHERLGLHDNPKSAKYRSFPIFQEPIGRPKKKEFTAFGFTSGIGSMLQGAKNAGFQITGNVEWRDYYRLQVNDWPNTFTANFPGAWIARSFEDVPKDLIPGQIDLAVGHPECGLYSRLSGSLKDRGTNFEKRATDVGDIPLFLEYVQKYRPRFFLMDDLPGSFAAIPIEEYARLLPDYDLFPEWVSNFYYGNIQKYRNRMFMIGALKSEKFVFVPGEETHDTVMCDIIYDLKDNTGQGIPNHQTVDFNKRCGRYANFRFYGDSTTYGDIRKAFQDNPKGMLRNKDYYTPTGERKYRPGTNDGEWEGYCPVLSGGYNPTHPTRFTPLTIRERARIQGFPDDFLFYTSPGGPEEKIWDPYQSIGNRGVKQTGKAMPVQFCEYFARQVKAHIEGKPFKTTGVRLQKENPAVSKAKQDYCRIADYSDQAKACGNCWLRKNCRIMQEKNF